MVASSNFFEGIGVRGSMPALNKAYADYRTTPAAAGGLRAAWAIGGGSPRHRGPTGRLP